MGWRDRLRAPSYRGVPFRVDSSNLEAGRRTQRHEFLNRDLPFVEDLGRRARAFSLEGYVVGDDYMEARDRLLAACEERGAGRLVHPYLGLLSAVCVSVNVREEKANGGRAVFSMIFEEAGRVADPERRDDPAGQVEDAVNELETTAEADLVERLTVVGSPEFVRQAGVEQTQTVGALIAGLDVFSGPEQEVASLARQAVVLIGQAQDLILSPADLANQVRVALLAVSTAAQDAFLSLNAYRQLFGLEPERDPVGTGAAELQAQENGQAIADLTRAVALGEACREAARAPWGFRQQALDELSRLLEEIDALSASATDPVFQDLQAVRQTIVGAVPPPAQALPVIREVTLKATVPSVLLAYWRYRDPRRGQEIVDRNRIPHPLFLPGGVPLEVLESA